jgi:hypothetical protein
MKKIGIDRRMMPRLSFVDSDLRILIMLHLLSHFLVRGVDEVVQ